MYIRNNWSLTPFIGLLLSAFLFTSVSYAAEPVCAVVKIEIQQELTLERQAFDAVMRINNGLDLLSLENVNINVTFKDETGAAVEATSDTTSQTAKFFIKIDSMSGITDVSGFGTVAPKSTAEVHWLIIPAPKSGGETPSGKLYFVGATLNYNLGGELQTTTVSPDSIYVKPLPLLSLDYFLEKDVFADDAFTPELEPAVPFTLGVRVKNNGAASATGLKIDSAQPTITENEQGLLIAFNIIGSNLNEQPLTNSLLIDFGEIKPNEASMGRWDMVTKLSGRFTEFTADFSHADDLGGRLTSIIDPAGINTHTLIRNVRVDVAGRDLVRDFLALDGTVYRVYESSGVDTDVNNASLGAILTPVSTGNEVGLTLTASVLPGFNYIKVKDDYAGTKVVKQIYRSDGKNIPLDNAWTSKTRLFVDGQNPTWEYWVNVFDSNTSGATSAAYTLLMGIPDTGPVAPVFTPMGNVTTYETAAVSFLVSATDANDDTVILSTGTLPAGATFTSDTSDTSGSGSGTFTWTPSVGQAGNHTIGFTASDGTLSNQATVNIRVNPVDDTDGDGLNDAWEIANFGNLNRDGTGDFDGDGISDLQEFLDQTDPDLVPPLAPINLVALPGNAENTLSWDTVTGVDSYNVYWSLTADVTPANSSALSATTSPFVHTGLNNDETYFYIVTSVGAGGESAASNMVSVTTGVRDWSAPVSLQSNSGLTFIPQNVQIAISANGNAIAVWQQTNNSLNSIWSSRYVPATGWATPALISNATVDSTAVQIAMDADGNAIAVWQQLNPVQTDIIATRYNVVIGNWETPVAIETDDVNAAVEPQIVISKTGTNSGNALVIWKQGTSIMSNNFVSLAWQGAAVVSDETITDISKLALSMNENGDAFAAWVTTVDQVNYDLRVNKFSTNIWSNTVVTLATALDSWLKPALNINASGNAVIAWPAFNGTRHVMTASQYDVTSGIWTTAQAIENNLGEARSAQVAMDTSGNAFVAWAQSGSPYSIYVNRFDASLGFAVSATLLEQRERGDASVPQLTIDGRGNAIVSWQHSDGVQQNILAAVYNNTDNIWSGERVIETTNSGDALLPAMAVSDSGNAIVVWQQNNNGALTIAANHFAVGNNGVPNIAPIAIAGVDQNVNEETAVTLDGSASFDQDGSGLISAYSWTQTAGTPVTLTAATTATPGFIAPTVLTADGPQTLTFELTVTDDAAATSVSTVNVVVNPVNETPVANAGITQNVNEQTVVTLTGSGSDNDGTIASYNWSQISGTAVTLSTANTASASFTSSVVTVQQGVQTLVFELTVTDNESVTATSQVNILVSPVNAAPVANAGLDQTVNEQSAVNLTGAASDTDGVIATYSWSQVSGLPVVLTDNTTTNVSFTAPTVLIQDGAQTIVLRLSVTDNEGAISSDDVSVVVNAVNALPIVSAGLPQTVDEQTTVPLLATSFDSDGTIVSHQWTQTAGNPVTITNATTISASFVAPVVLVQNGPQQFSFTLTITDNEGAVVTSTPVTITVNPVNANPTVNAGLDHNVNEQTAVNLTAAANDADGSISSYNWTQVSGVPVTLTGATTVNVSFTAPTVLVQDGAQTLTFRLTVTDNETATVFDDINVVVNPVNANPTANAGVDKSVDEQTLVTLPGSGADTDGSISTYEWTQTAGVAATLTNANAANATFTAPTVLVQDGAKTLTFRLTVTDNETATVFDDVNVVVNPVNASPTVNAGADQTVNEQTAVTLAGSGADTDGSITAYQWTQTGGSAVTLTGASTANATFNAPIVLVQDGAQTLTFRLTVTDNETATVFDDINVVVNPVNEIPVANSGLDQSIDEQTLATLAGSGSDADGSITTYSWSQTAGIPVTLTGATTATATFTTPVVLTQDGAQTLTFSLTVMDNEAAVHTDVMNVVVNPVNANPTVNAGHDQTIDEQTPLSLTAAANDADGSIASYNWSQVSGMPVTLTDTTTAVLSFTTPTVLVPQGVQNLVFRVSVTDNENAVVSDDVIVTVNPVNANPIVSAGADQTVDELAWVALNGTASDTDGSIITHEWTQVAGPVIEMLNANTAIMGFNAPRLKQQMTLTFRLTVTDNEIAEVFDEVSVVVNPVNTLPIADVGADQSVAETLNVILDGSASNDPDVDGSIVSYSWTQTAGLSVNLVNANTAMANFTAPSVYQDEVVTFRLDIVDDEDGVAFATTNVTLFSTNPDDDADGMLDVWEVQYFGNLNRDGTADDDADGATDLMEHNFGTDPFVSQGPGQPAIASPRGTEVTSLQPTLTVDNGIHHASFTTTYEFEVYNDEAMTTLITSTSLVAEGVSTTEWIVDTPLNDNTRYYWRARSSGWVLHSDWVTNSFFVNTVNDAPTAFNISTPQDGIWVNSFTPKLSVTNSSDVDEDKLTYRFEVYADQAMTSLVTSSSETVPGMNGVTSWTTDTTLFENTWYTWRAVVTDEHRLSTTSNSASIFINTINDAPAIPVIVSPLKGTEITTLQTDMVVTNAIDPEAETVTYFFELDTVNTFDSLNKRTSAELPEGVNETAWFVDNLTDNTRYYWRVKASDGRAQSNWRNGEFFVNTVNDIPGVPTLDNPTNNGWVGSMDPSLMVLPVIDLDEDKLSYEFEVYDSDRLGNIGTLHATVVKNTTYWQVTPVLPADGWYKWRARAIDEHGAVGDWAKFALFYADSDGVNDAPRIKLDALKRIRKRMKKFCDLPTRITHRKYSWKHKDYDQTYKDKCREFVTIKWTDHDPDSNAFIKLFYSNTNKGQGGTLIKKGLREDPDHRKDTYRWEVTNLPDGVYFVYAVIKDGTTRKVRYSPNAIVVGDGAGQPYMEFTNKQRKAPYSTSLKIKWADIDVDSNANIALYYNTNKFGYDGTLIVDGLTENKDFKNDRYLWDITTIPVGKYFIYGVIQDETQTLRIYSPVRYKITAP